MRRVIDKKIIPRSKRDRRRAFHGGKLEARKSEAGHRCTHPCCDGPHLSLEAHHILQHARGGVTQVINGLVFCTRCHRLLHAGFMPLRLVLDIKLGLRRDSVAQPPIASVDADDLASRAVAIKTTGLSAADRFAALNDVLAEANYLPTYASKCFVLSQALLAKASVLNYGASPIRRTLQHTMISMNSRRAWAQNLARHAARYADSISDHCTAARAYHVIAVAYNARNLFPQAIAGHRRALTYIGSCRFARGERTAVSMPRSRILRESAVCMAKRSAGSTAAAERVHESLALTRASGDPHAIDDALIRCCETHTYLGDYRAATSWLDELNANWSRMDGNLRTIATKLAARLLVCRNEETAAWAAIERGQALADAHGLQHQRYHFKRLIWQLQEGRDGPRQTILT